MKPFYFAQNGGQISYYVNIGLLDVSSQVSEITGLSYGFDFSGGMTSSQVTVTLSGWPKVSEYVLEGASMLIAITTPAMVDIAWHGLWIVRTVDLIDPAGGAVKVTGEPVMSEMFPGDYNFYTTEAWEPRELVAAWLKAADVKQSLSSLTAPTYQDGGFQRALSRVAAPAASLNALSGFTDTAATIYTQVRKGTQADTSQWTSSWAYSYGYPPTVDFSWTAAPGFAEDRSQCGQKPLAWHVKGETFQLIWTARETFPATSSQRCQFPLGVVEGLYLSFRQISPGHIDWMHITDHYLSPSETKPMELTFKSRKEAADFYRQNAQHTPPPGSPTSWGMSKYSAGEKSQIKRWGGSRTVKITDVATYTGIKASFYSAARAVLAPTAPVSGHALGESIDFGERVICWTSQQPINFEGQEQNAIFTMTYIPQRMDSLWQEAGVTSYSTLAPGYQLQQSFHPITIAQDYTTRAIVQQACVLGSLGIMPGFTGDGSTQTGVSLVDTCPESGSVFFLALTVHTVADVVTAEQYPMPRAYDITFRDQNNSDRTYTVTDSKGTADPMSIDCMQGSCQGWQQPVSSGGYQYISLSSTSWAANPGGLADRWTGSYMSSGSLAGFTALTSPFPARGAKVILADGTVKNRTTNTANFSAATTYAVRGADGVEVGAFCTEANIGIDSPPGGGEQADPYLDGFPLFSFLEAHGRCYSDNYNRQAYRLSVTHAFATCFPGSVVAVQLPQIFGGAKTLALVISGDYSTGGPITLTIVPMHKITANDYKNYTLTDVI